MKNSKKKPVPMPPKELNSAGRGLWKALQEVYGIDDPGGVSLLLTVCRSEDDIQRMRRAVAKDGDCLTDRFGQQQSHPLLQAIRGCEAVKRQALRGLNLDLEPNRDRPGRPEGS